MARPVDDGRSRLVAACDGPKFVITGCGRSGTTYVARVLETLGCRTRHEHLFDPARDVVPEFGAWHGDVSWAAAPLVERLPAGMVVLHQVRDPLAVMRSVHEFGLVEGRLGLSLRHDVGRAGIVTLARVRARLGQEIERRPPAVVSYKRMIHRHRPDVWEPADVFARCARYWVAWNELAERAAGLPGVRYRRFRLEDLDARLLTELLTMTGHDVDEAACAGALAAVPPDTNTRGSTGDLGWDHLPPRERSEVRTLAERYGYPV